MSLKSMLRAIGSHLGRILRCHPVTWIVTLVTAIAVAVLILRGEVVPRQGEEVNTWSEQARVDVEAMSERLIAESQLTSPIPKTPWLVEHGWPSPWLVRSVAVQVTGGTWPLKKQDEWPFESFCYQVHLGHLVLNVLLALSLVIAVGMLTERWLRRRGGLFRFRIIDLLGVATVIAMGLGWWGYHGYVNRIEERVLFELGVNRPSVDTRAQVFKRYEGPEWLRRLAGRRKFLDRFDHVWFVVAMSRAKTGDDGIGEDDSERLATLPYLKRIQFERPVTFSAIETLENCTRVETMSFNMHDTWESIRYHEVLRGEGKWIGPTNLDRLAPLRLRQLELRGPLIILEDIETALEANSGLRRVELTWVSITPSDLAKLQRRYPDTAISITWGPEGEATEAMVTYVRHLRDAIRHGVEPTLPSVYY